MSSTRDALEAALAANPDDVVAHAAYADLLIEEDDPRGEYIRLLLELEERNQLARSLEFLHNRVRDLEAAGTPSNGSGAWSPATDG